MKLKIVNKSDNPLPEYKTEYSAGMDLMANNEQEIELKPLERALVPTGIFIELPEGYEAQIRPRSGLSLKSGISLVNSPGTIDADYRGEIGIILVNLSNENFIVKKGERIAQMIIAKYVKADIISVDVLNESVRGDGGFGSTGSN